jgi:hypothetical protein
MNTALEHSTRVVQEGGRRCKKSTLNDLVHLTPQRIPLITGRQLPPLSSVLYGIISERRTVLAAQLLLREKSGG